MEAEATGAQAGGRWCERIRWQWPPPCKGFVRGWDYRLKVLRGPKKSRAKGIMRLKGLQLSHVSFDSPKV